MSKTKLMVVAGLCLAFGAGVVVGVAVMMRLADPAAAGGEKRQHWWIGAELGLSAQQEEQVRKIWDESRKEASRERDERRTAARKARDDAVLAMLPAEKHSTYEKIKQDYTDAMGQLDQQRPKAIEKAVEQTKLVLTERQRVKYEELLKKMEQDRRNHGQLRRGYERATTRPAATQPSR